MMLIIIKLMYFTKGGDNAGVHGKNALGQFLTNLEGPAYIDETTVLTFHPMGNTCISSIRQLVSS
jgi:hypothetical protein